MTLFSLLLIAGTFRFGGGTVNEAVAAFSEQSKEPVVAIAVQPFVRRFSFEMREPQQTRTAFGKSVGLASEKGRAAFGPASLPPPFHYSDPEALKEYDKLFPAGGDLLRGVKNGKVSIGTGPDAYLNVADLTHVRFGKRLTVHWLVGRCRLSARVADVSEEEFLRYVASAAVAKLSVGDKTYALDLDIQRYRKLRVAAVLAIAAIKSDRSRYPRREELRCRIEAEALRVVTDEQLSAVMRVQGGPNRVTLEPKPLSPLGRLAREFVRELIDPSPSGVRQASSIADHLRSVVDVNQPPLVVISQDRVGVVLIGRDPTVSVYP